VILDGLGMSVAYFPADTKEEAQAYVDYRNLIENIRLRQLRDEAHAIGPRARRHGVGAVAA